jgi:hypothetical protein
MDYKREYYEKNKHVYKERYQRKREDLITYQTKWNKENTDKRRAICAKRRAMKIQATPMWVDYDKIKEIYKEAKRLEELTGIQFHVDHIVPLNHKEVCGLHCEDNLQILTAIDNMRKGNEFNGRQ